MAPDFDTNKTKRSVNRFSRLGTWYILALSVIATVAIIGQLLIQSHLQDQLNDSRVVNVAGKQRMLSQKITKIILLLHDDQPLEERRRIAEQLQSSVHLWKLSQDGLLHGNDSLKLPGENSKAVVSLFNAVNEHFQVMHQSALTILSKIKRDNLISYDSLRPEIMLVLMHEDDFLLGMESIVFQYADEAQNKVARLSKIEYLVLLISLCVIALEIIFIFRPTAVHVNKTLNKLIASEKNARKLTKEIGALYASLEKSYEQISMVNQPMESPRLYAKADRGGNVIFIADSFSTITGKEEVLPGMRLCDLFPQLPDADDWMDHVVDTVSDGKLWQGEVTFTNDQSGTCWMDITIIPLYGTNGEIEELLMLGSNITSRKEAEHNMKRKNKAEIEKKINQQKFRSVLILEGQEEERKRLAMDIHDGIGQMLTSLKFQIESINLKEGEKAQQKIVEVDHLIKDVIKEVRRVTFNLKPTVLGDYGLQAALNVFIQEIGKVTPIELTLDIKGKIERLPQKVENNIFRIVQEAINNAIKYSETKRIAVELWQSDTELIVSVKDEGKGFDAKMIESRNINIESGGGFFNMYERTAYINGKLDIVAEPGKGTVVSLHVPVRNAVLAD